MVSWVAVAWCVIFGLNSIEYLLPGCPDSFELVHALLWSVALGQRLLPQSGHNIICDRVIGHPSSFVSFRHS